MTNTITILSDKATQFLSKNYYQNINKYYENKSSEELWSWIESLLKENNLCDHGHKNISGELKSNPVEDYRDLGIYLYENLGPLDIEILMMPGLWAGLSHKYFHEYHLQSIAEDIEIINSPVPIIVNGKEKKPNSRQLYLISQFPRGLNRCKISRYYFCAKWIADLLKRDREHENKYKDFSFKDCYDQLSKDSDFLLQIMDRTTFGKPLIEATIDITLERYLIEKQKFNSKDERAINRTLFKTINRIFGGAMLEVLSYEELKELLLSELKKIIENMN